MEVFLNKEFGSFIDEIYKRGIEAMLESELDAHLGYLKNQNKPDINNAGNPVFLRFYRTLMNC